MKNIDWKQIFIKNGIKPKKRMVINCDIDGTLTKDICWTKEMCINAKPNIPIIELLWSIYNDMEYLPQIIIYTARRTKFARETIEWLERNNIPFPISFRKNAGDIYIDDLSIRPDNIFKSLKH